MNFTNLHTKSVCNIKTRHQTSFCSETKIEFEKRSKKTIRFLISRNGRRPNRIERYSTTRKKGSIWNPFTRNGFYLFQWFHDNGLGYVPGLIVLTKDEENVHQDFLYERGTYFLTFEPKVVVRKNVKPLQKMRSNVCQ